MKNIFFSTLCEFLAQIKKSGQTVTEIRRKIQGEQLLSDSAVVTS